MELRDGPALQHATHGMYSVLLRELSGPDGWHPARIWNHVPGLLSDGGEGLNRYMRFNAGRHKAFAERLGPDESFGRLFPAGSAIGTDRNELVIHALACRIPGVAVANPRQRPPYRYSQRFGPLPPCFARATLIDDPRQGRMLLVGGTASIRGEESVHIDNLDAQLDETFENLAALTRSCPGAGGEPMGCYRELRVYHVHRHDAPAIRSRILARFAGLRRVEFAVADLCRPDLLVEIEGLASLRP